MNKKQVEDVVKSKKEGSVYDSYGPVQLNDLEVWEVWVKDDGEFATRFVALDALESASYFSEFQLSMDVQHQGRSYKFGGTPAQSK